MNGFTIVLVCLEAVNLLAFALMGIDKRRARLHRERIPEAALLAAAALGGSVGAIAGMLLFRHKTKKARFRVGLPVILAMQLVFVLLLFYVVSHGNALQ